jgi:hypothetical protein
MNRYLPVIFGLLLLFGPAVSAQVIPAAIGDPVPLAGYAPGADGVYLFATGPNLPANGVRLDDISAPVMSGDPSSFTRTSVDNDRWAYTWYTRTKGGTPDAGTYTIFIVTTPVGREDLAGAAYATVLVSLGSPRIGMVTGGDVTVGASPQENDSVPDGSARELKGAPQRDRTPGTGNGSAPGPDTPLDGTGTGNTPQPSGTASPLPTSPEKIPFPTPAVLAAWGCAIAWMVTKKTR